MYLEYNFHQILVYQIILHKANKYISYCEKKKKKKKKKK